MAQHSAEKRLHVAPILPERVGKVKPEPRRSGWLLSTSGCQAAVGQTSAAHTFRLERYPLLALPILIVAGYGMAARSWSLLERPFLRFNRFFEAKPGRLDRAPGH